MYTQKEYAITKSNIAFQARGITNKRPPKWIYLSTLGTYWNDYDNILRCLQKMRGKWNKNTTNLPAGRLSNVTEEFPACFGWRTTASWGSSLLWNEKCSIWSWEQKVGVYLVLPSATMLAYYDYIQVYVKQTLVLILSAAHWLSKGMLRNLFVRMKVHLCWCIINVVFELMFSTYSLDVPQIFGQSFDLPQETGNPD